MLPFFHFKVRDQNRRKLPVLLHAGNIQYLRGFIQTLPKGFSSILHQKDGHLIQQKQIKRKS
jgi:hypothetical protein